MKNLNPEDFKRIIEVAGLSEIYNDKNHKAKHVFFNKIKNEWKRLCKALNK